MTNILSYHHHHSGCQHHMEDISFWELIQSNLCHHCDWWAAQCSMCTDTNNGAFFIKIANWTQCCQLSCLFSYLSSSFSSSVIIITMIFVVLALTVIVRDCTMCTPLIIITLIILIFLIMIIIAITARDCLEPKCTELKIMCKRQVRPVSLLQIQSCTYKN